MKKILAIIIFFSLFKFSSIAQMPEFYNTNVAGGANAFPLNTTTNIQMQWIYGPGVFNSMGATGTPAYFGLITDVYIRLSSHNPSAIYTNFEISLGQNLGTQDNWGTGGLQAGYPFTTGLTSVFFQASYPFVGQYFNNWYRVTLQTPFLYDPSLSLIVEVKSSSRIGTGSNVSNVSTAGINQRLYGGFGAITGTANTGLTNFGFDMIPGGQALKNNSSLVNLDSPGEVICTNTSRVAVSIRNDGTDTLNNLQLSWNVVRPGMPIPFPTQIINWTGGILPDSTLSNVNLGNFQGGFQPGDLLTIWSELPNGDIDSSTALDTIRIRMQNGDFGGTFTIGDTTAGANDFVDMSHAVSYLNSLEGLCDSIVFIIRDNQTFTGQYTIKRIPGASFNRPIVFKSESNNPNLVKLTYNSNDPDSNFTVRFNESNGVIFRGIEIEAANNTTTNPIGTAVLLEEKSRQIRFENCILTSAVNGGNSDNASVIRTKGEIERFELIKSTILRGTYGLNADGGLRPNQNWRLIGNTFTNQRISFVKIDNLNNSDISYNLATSNSNTANTTGINAHGFSFSGASSCTFSNNKFYSNSVFPSIGIYFRNSSSAASNPNRVFNNAFTVGVQFSSTTFEGIVLEDCFSLNLYNNTVAIRGTGSQNAALRIENGGGLEVVNNNFATFGQGYAMYVEGLSPVNRSDFNNYFSNGNQLINQNNTNFATLPQFQNTFGSDDSSKSVNPNFRSVPTNLIPCNTDLDSAGTPLFTVFEDLNNNFRDPIYPDIGAYEFIDLNSIKLAPEYRYCDGDTVTLFGSPYNHDFSIWSTGDSSNVINLTNGGNYTLVLVNECGSNILNTSLVPSIPVVLNLDSFKLCGDTSVILDATVNESATYQWNTGASTPTLLVNQAGNYQVTVTNSIGCVSEATSDISEFQNPQILSNLTNGVFCKGKPAFLDAGVPNVNYKWSNNVVSPTNQITVINSGGLYYVEINDQGCISSDTILIEEVDPPVALFTGQNSFFTWQFVNQSTPPNLNYFWDFGDGNSSTSKDPVHVYGSPGIYTVRLTVSNSCGPTSTTMKVTAISVGVEELMQQYDVSVYPNPTQSIVNLNYNANVAKLNSMQIIDTKGAVLNVNRDESNSGLMQLDFSNLPAGNYFIKMQLNEDVLNLPIIKF